MLPTGPRLLSDGDAERRQTLRDLHRKGWYSFWQSLGIINLFFLIGGVSLLCWHSPLWPLVVCCWAVQAHVGHANLIAFHEAAHYLLHPWRRVNEGAGILVGSFIMTPLSVYRHVHNLHHLHLGTPRDIEMWPFVNPPTARGWRILAAAGELLLGFFYTPVVFLHGVLTTPPKSSATRRRIVGEYALCVAWWTVLLGVVAWSGQWEAWLISYLVPAMIAGNLQSLRKFTEHMGMLGDDVPSLTRTVVAPDLVGRFLSGSMLHIDIHGIHHRYAKIPHYRLEEAVPHVYDAHERATAIQPTYREAMFAMLATLGNPRVGKQWLETAKPAVTRRAA